MSHISAMQIPTTPPLGSDCNDDSNYINLKTEYNKSSFTYILYI